MEIKSNLNVGRKERRKVAVIDFGDSVNITRYLMETGYLARVFPVSAYDKIDRWKADGLLLSDGPGNPNTVFQYSAELLKDLKLSRTPVFGIGLGHQLMALAEGFLVSRRDAKYQGLPQPVKNLITGEVKVIQQYHAFSVNSTEADKKTEITHVNINDRSVEGLRFKNYPGFSFQYHPNLLDINFPFFSPTLLTQLKRGQIKNQKILLGNL